MLSRRGVELEGGRPLGPMRNFAQVAGGGGGARARPPYTSPDPGRFAVAYGAFRRRFSTQLSSRMSVFSQPAKSRGAGLPLSAPGPAPASTRPDVQLAVSALSTGVRGVYVPPLALCLALEPRVCATPAPLSLSAATCTATSCAGVAMRVLAATLAALVAAFAAFASTRATSLVASPLRSLLSRLQSLERWGGWAEWGERGKWGERGECGDWGEWGERGGWGEWGERGECGDWGEWLERGGCGVGSGGGTGGD